MNVIKCLTVIWRKIFIPNQLIKHTSWAQNAQKSLDCYEIRDQILANAPLQKIKVKICKILPTPLGESKSELTWIS